jgi:1-hydroxycarotenoid 3,4-desaturase
VVIVGAGIGGLAAALRLATAGCAVTVVEAQDGPGGKMRTLPSEAGPVDAGPTVLTMREVFEDLFTAAGTRLSDHVTLDPLEVLARHYWDDGTVFDLTADPEDSARNVRASFGAAAEGEFRRFRARAARLFSAFEAPMMRAAQPSQAALAKRVLADPRLLWDMSPHRRLAGSLARSFTDPRLAQLYGRYATYVGGTPQGAPALLALISEAEARGVWAVRGGMAMLARAIEVLAREAGATFLYGTRVQQIETVQGRATGVATTAGRIPAGAVLFNGDPRALVQGLLGPRLRNAVPESAVEPRSLSAYVHAFAARAQGPDLSHHTVFFGHDPEAEFAALARGERPSDATLYLCAQDRTGTTAPPGLERFEIILNGPPVSTTATDPHGQDVPPCQTQVFNRLRAFGLSFDPQPGPETLTTPTGFQRLFPGSRGSLYGRSPHGLTAGLKRPGARTAVPGLYLAGGGAHPGAGVPMATLSAAHAAEAILTDLASRSPSRRTAMPGGMSTGSARTGPAPSPSSAS